MPKLSRIPSVLLNQGLDDLEAVRKTPGYLIYMDDWHIPNWDGNGNCAVCLGGAACVRNLGDEYIRKDGYDLNWDALDSAGEQDQIRALNEFRCGHIDDALSWLHTDLPAGLERSWPITTRSPHTDKELDLHITEMRAMAQYLAANGL